MVIANSTGFFCRVAGYDHTQFWVKSASIVWEDDAMGNIMLASKMTNDQINDLVNTLRDAASEDSCEFDQDAVQQILRSPNLGRQLLAVFHNLMENVNRQKQIIHIVPVDRSRARQQLLDASYSKEETTKAVVEAMPCSTGNEVKLIYFQLPELAYKNKWLLCQTIDDAYKKLNLVPDPSAQMVDNTANLGFANIVPNACQWKDENNNWCYVTFRRLNGVLQVIVEHSNSDWFGNWWFAGVPKN